MVKKTIIISINNYEEMFDDFDLSELSKRAFSIDFLKELRRRTPSNSDFSIVITLPSKLRNKKVEALIIKRLKKFFRLKKELFSRLYMDVMKRGITYVLIGILLLLLSSFVEFYFETSTSILLSNFLLIPSWFFVWSGLDKILESSSKYKNKANFYYSLYKSQIDFEKVEKYENK